MAKKSKINLLHQAHGKVEKRPLTLDQVWGDTGTSKYGTLDKEIYAEYLEALNKSDLQSHASKIGLVPIDDRKTLIGRLKKEFQKHIAIYKPSPQVNRNNVPSKTAKQILSEGS
jgi:hypothetical protein